MIAFFSISNFANKPLLAISSWRCFGRNYLHVRYGNTGCRVSKWGIQNWKDFCLKINIAKGNYWVLRIGVVAIENGLWKSNFSTFWHLSIQQFPLGMLIFRQKSFQFCIQHLKTWQPVLPYPGKTIFSINHFDLRSKILYTG